MLNLWKEKTPTLVSEEEPSFN